MSCLTAGTFCIGYTVYHYWTIYLQPPSGLIWWVPHAFGVICIVMAALGGYFIFGSARIIRAVQAVPTARLLDLSKTKTPKLPAAAQKALAAHQTPNGSTPPILLEVEIGRMLPFLSARQLYVAPMAMALPMRLATLGLTGDRFVGSDSRREAEAGEAESGATGYERVLARRAEEARRKKARQYEMDHLMTAPFRHAWQGARVAWSGIGRAFSRDGFLPVEIDGQRYKLDVSGGWALEKGRALDRLVAIKEGQMS